MVIRSDNTATSVGSRLLESEQSVPDLVLGTADFSLPPMRRLRYLIAARWRLGLVTLVTVALIGALTAIQHQRFIDASNASIVRVLAQTRAMTEEARGLMAQPLTLPGSSSSGERRIGAVPTIIQFPPISAQPVLAPPTLAVEPPQKAPAPAISAPAVPLRISVGKSRASQTLDRARSAVAQQQWPIAEASLVELMRSEPSGSQVYWQANQELANLYRSTGRDALARQLLWRQLRQRYNSANTLQALLQTTDRRELSRLRHWLGQQESAQNAQHLPLIVAGARICARLGDWRCAQQYYFSALQLEPERPEHRYNMAVTLERLGHPREAETYYRQALALSAGREISFDPDHVARRLALIE